jgi:hypothetical protein
MSLLDEYPKAYAAWEASSPGTVVTDAIQAAAALLAGADITGYRFGLALPSKQFARLERECEHMTRIPRSGTARPVEHAAVEIQTRAGVFVVSTVDVEIERKCDEGAERVRAKLRKLVGNPEDYASKGEYLDALAKRFADDRVGALTKWMASDDEACP